jgi:hypothetical protein
MPVPQTGCSAERLALKGEQEGVELVSGSVRPPVCRQMDARNGVTRQRLSQQWEQAARPDALMGGMSQEANAPGNAGDMLTWDRLTRRHWDRMSLSLRHALRSSVVKTGRKSNSDCADAKLRGRVIAHNGVPMTKARVTEEPRDWETITRGSVVAAGWATAPPTITEPTAPSCARLRFAQAASRPFDFVDILVQCGGPPHPALRLRRHTQYTSFSVSGAVTRRSVIHLR